MELQNFDIPLGVEVEQQEPKKKATKKATKPARDPAIDAEARKALTYFYGRYDAQHGIKYPQLWHKDIGIFRGFIRRYGAEWKALIDYLFDHHGGKYGFQNQRAEVQGTPFFCEGSDILVQNLRTEMHGLPEWAKSERRQAESGGWSSGEDFLALKARAEAEQCSHGSPTT